MCKERPMPRRRHNLGLGWLVAATALVGCGSPQAGWADDAWARDLPPWALQPQEAYPEAQYMSAIGSGRTMDQAERDALRRLAQRFRVMLDSVETQLDDYIAQVGDQIPGTDWEETTNLLSTIRLRSTLELLNARIAERAVSEDGRHAFALAVVERRPTARLYERQMEINRQAAETHFALAEEAPEGSQAEAAGSSANGVVRGEGAPRPAAHPGRARRAHGLRDGRPGLRRDRVGIRVGAGFGVGAAGLGSRVCPGRCGTRWSHR
jgi:hypothetical protein